MSLYEPKQLADSMPSHTTSKIFVSSGTSGKYGVIKRDYAVLDEIHPNRIRSVEQWLRREDQLGKVLGKGGLWERVQPENMFKALPLLKLTEDGRKGKL